MNRLSGYWALKYVLWILFLLAFLILIVLPLATSLLITNSPNLPLEYASYIKSAQKSQVILIQLLTGLWFFYIGSCFASFLNVVAYRIPRGQSILGSSHCPHCQTRLTFRDNVPVFGWLKNNGCCRTCRTPITSRYFLVEVALGILYLSLVLLSLVTGGMNLPLRIPNKGTGFERVLFDPKWDLIQIVFCQLTLISILFTFGLIKLEEKPLPVSILIFGIIVAVVTAFLFPSVLIVPWHNPGVAIANYSTPEIHQFLWLGLAGLTGVLVGCGMTWQRVEFRREAVFSCLLVGLFLGWQSSLSVALILALLGAIFRWWDPFSWHQLNLATKIVVATMIHLVFWKLLSLAGGFWPNHQSNAIQVVLAIVVMILSTSLTHRPIQKYPIERIR